MHVLTSPEERRQLMSSIELDFMYETDPQSEATAFAARFDAQAEVITEHGPAGGWPVVRFTGTTEAIKRLESTYNDQAYDGQANIGLT